MKSSITGADWLDAGNRKHYKCDEPKLKKTGAGASPLSKSQSKDMKPCKQKKTHWYKHNRLIPAEISLLCFQAV